MYFFLYISFAIVGEHHAGENMAGFSAKKSAASPVQFL